MPRAPSFPRVYHRRGAPDAWFWPAQGPRRTFPGDPGDVADLTGSAPALTRGGGTAYAPGPAGTELAFDGTGSALLLPADYARLNTPTVRWTVRFRVDSFANAYTSVASDESGSAGLTLLVKANGKLAVYASGTTTGGYHYDGTGNFTLTPGVYYTADVVCDGTTITCYVNGAVDAAVSAPAALVPTGRPLFLGDRQVGGRALTGRVADFRVGRPAGAAEVARDAADPAWRLRPPGRTRYSAPAAPPGPAAAWSACTLPRFTAAAAGTITSAGSAAVRLARVTAAGSGSVTRPGYPPVLAWWLLFPGAGGIPAPALRVAAGFYEAFVAWFGADPVCRAACPGGLFDREAPPDPATPYARAWDVENLEPVSPDDAELELALSTYAPDDNAGNCGDAAARDAGRAVLDRVLDPAARTLTPFRHMGATWGEAGVLWIPPGKLEVAGKMSGGRRVWRYDVWLKFFLTRVDD